MDQCIKCESTRIAFVGAKCSDRCFFEYNGKEHDGYVLNNVGIGGGDYVEFGYCLECGQIQDDFPVEDPEI